MADDKGMKSSEDVIRTVPGTDIGGHDIQGTDGKTRTDRPGDILGTPNPDQGTASRTKDNREREQAKHDYVREAVDKNNREVLPKLGGNIDDNWEADGKTAKVEVPAGITNRRSLTGTPVPPTTQAPSPGLKK